MCLICIEYQKKKMTVSEARRALDEMWRSHAIDSDHAHEVEKMLNDDTALPWFIGWDDWLSAGTD